VNKVFYVGIGSLLTGCLLVNARPSHTGHLYVTVTDFETGGPVTNATATVRAQTEFNIGRTLESYFTKTSAQTDTNGVAHVQFLFYDDDFSWWVESPTHYSGVDLLGFEDESFDPVVVESDYANIDTNTVDGLAKYNELALLYSTDYMAYAAKFNPKSITYPSNAVHRSVCLTPKHNPQPMYAHYLEDDVSLPIRNTTAATNNGVEVVQYDPVDFDMKEGLVICTEPDYDYWVHGPTGKNSDFRIERYRVITNGVKTIHGMLAFSPGCGAYITQLPGGGHYPLIYEADTNATFLSRIPFEYSIVSGRVVQTSQLLSKNECMVLKTRAMTNEVGEVVSCNYSKIYGPMSVDRRLRLDTLVFNPTPNDPNLESNCTNNLAKPYGHRWARP